MGKQIFFLTTVQLLLKLEKLRVAASDLFLFLLQISVNFYHSLTVRFYYFIKWWQVHFMYYNIIIFINIFIKSLNFISELKFASSDFFVFFFYYFYIVFYLFIHQTLLLLQHCDKIFKKICYFLFHGLYFLVFFLQIYYNFI